MKPIKNLAILVSIVCICCVMAFYPYAVAVASADYTFYTEIAGHEFIYPHAPMLAVDGYGDLWLCAKGLVCRYSGGAWENFSDQSGGGSYISSSEDGSIWIAGDTKLALYDGERWTVYNDLFDGQNYTVQGISSFFSDVLYLKIVDRSINKAYLGIFENGELSVKKEGLFQNNITRLSATPEGVWIIYHTSFDQIDCIGDNCPKGISFYDGTSFRHYTVENGLPGYENDPDDITDVSWLINARHKENTVYMICNSYFGSFSDGEWTTITNHMWGILYNGFNDKIWNGHIGSRHGSYLRYYDGSDWIEYDVSEIATYMRSTYYYPGTFSIAETSNGDIWMGTDYGVLRIDPSSLSVIDGTSVDSQKAPEPLTLFHCYPNPFNSTATIHFNLSEGGDVAIKIYSISGQLIRNITSHFHTKGEYFYSWNGLSEKNSCVSTGVYLVVAENGHSSQTKAITYLK